MDLDLHLVTGSDIRPVGAKRELGNVLAAKRLSEVAKMDRIGVFSWRVGVCGGVDGEGFVVAEGVDGSLGEEAGVVDGAVVDDLDESLVFVGDGCVVDVD